MVYSGSGIVISPDRPVGRYPVLCGMTNFDVIAVRVRTFMGVLTPFIAGFAIAYLLNTPMCFFERKLYQKQKHPAWAGDSDGLSDRPGDRCGPAQCLIIPQVAQSVVDLATNQQTISAPA